MSRPEHAPRPGAGFVFEECDGVPLWPQKNDLPIDDPNALADLVIEQWRRSSEAIILACAYLATAIDALGENDEYLKAFLGRLVSGGVLSENDALARLRAHGKLSMLRKIGQHAGTLLEPSILNLLPPSYSIIYQFCLLVDDIGADQAKLELSKFPDVSREDLINRRAELKREAESQPAALTPLDDVGVQLFALQPSARELRLFGHDYVQPDTLNRCLRRPDPADDAGLVAVLPILMLGQFERTLMTLLGFRKVTNLFLENGVSHPDITDRDVIVVAERGGFRSRPLTAFPASLNQHDVLSLAECIFPNSTRRCQLFAQQRAEGWLTFVGNENWNELPSLS
jgi:hypothetical protein